MLQQEMNSFRLKTAIIVAFALLSFLVVGAQDFTKADTLKFYNALNFKLINKGFHNSETPYYRLPAVMKDSVRPNLYSLSRCTAGEAIRFRTNSHCVAVRYNLISNFTMAHMAPTGIKGMDLYILDGDKWVFLNCNRPYRDYSGATPRKDSIQSKIFIDKLDGEMHEYMMYLPLYDGVNWVEIGVEPNAQIQMPQVNSPRHDKKFVFYGTSIMQGGCACRPGMVATSILQRDLNVECVNLGFSGEGKMDYCMARTMATIPNVHAFIIDPVPNCTKMMCDTLTYEFVKILRTLRPDVPIFMVEGLEYSYTHYSSYYNKYLAQKNYEFHKNYLKLKKENPRNLYYIDNKKLWGPDNEGVVDGIHFTDIGFYWYAQKLKPYLEAVLKGSKVPLQKEVNKPYPEIPDPDNYNW
jgi:hypothetical protein